MCYQVCIAFPFSSRFSKTKLNLQHHGESRCGQLEAPIKNDHRKKSRARCHCEAFAWICGWCWFLIFQRNSKHLWNCWKWNRELTMTKTMQQTTISFGRFFFGWERDPCSWMHLFGFHFWGDDFPTSTSPRPGISYSHSETKGMRRTAGVTLPWNKVGTGKFMKTAGELK